MVRVSTTASCPGGRARNAGPTAHAARGTRHYKTGSGSKIFRNKGGGISPGEFNATAHRDYRSKRKHVLHLEALDFKLALESIEPGSTAAPAPSPSAVRGSDAWLPTAQWSPVSEWRATDGSIPCMSFLTARAEQVRQLIANPAELKSFRERQRLRKMPRHTRTATTLLPGGLMHLVDSASFLAQYYEIWRGGIYDLPMQTDAKPTIIDVGANVGTAVRYWKYRFPGAKIVALEPDPGVFAVLEQNTDGLSDVTLIPAAASTPTIGSRFAAEGADAGRLGDGTLVVATVRLADVVADAGHVDLLKLDIEGAETEVLLDSASALAAAERVFIEYHSFLDKSQMDLATLLNLLTESGFRLQVQAPMAAARPFLDVPSYNGMDLQLNVFGFRD